MAKKKKTAAPEERRTRSGQPLKKKKPVKPRISAGEAVVDVAVEEALASIPSETRKIGELIMDVANANKHDDRSIETIGYSLQRFGQVQDLVIRPNNVLVGGEGRLKAMIKLGWETCSVKVFQGSDQEAMALAIALNRTAEFSEWDNERLAEQIDSIADDFDLDKLGFKEEELDDILGEVEAEIENVTNEIAEEDSDNNEETESVFEVVIQCADEDDQRVVHDLMVEKGYTCRVLTI